jgi:hypothetical protein
VQLIDDAAGSLEGLQSSVLEKNHEYILDQLLDPDAPRNKQFSGRRRNRHNHDASGMKIVLHREARDPSPSQARRHERIDDYQASRK